MKRLLLFSLFLLVFKAINAQELSLNNAGHIIIKDDSKEAPIYSMEKGEIVISFKDMKFEGNAFYEISNGYFTLETYEASVPVTMRFYNKVGTKVKTIHFNRVYGIDFSQNKSHLIFFDANNLIALNTNDFSVKKLPSASVYCIDNNGVPISYNEKNRMLEFGESSISFEEKPNKILIHNNQTFIFTRHTIYFIEDNEIKSIHKIEGTFFQALSHNNNLYYVNKVSETNQFIFKLFKLGYNKDFIEIETEIYRRSNKRNLHEAIPSPLKYGEEHPHPIGNSYGEIQIYGGSPYLHPGVDFLGVENENVYAVKNGVVKAVLSTGGTYYWRIAIANENTNLETTGYLYAHLIETSIPFIPGDEVSAGDIVGELIFWPWYSFTHLHFARIKSQGEIWDGAWWTSNDPLVDVTGYVDDTPPSFENAKEEDLFAFRDESGNYLNPLELSDDIRIICKAHDIANSNWKIDVSELGYKIYSADEPTVPLVEKISFAYDFMLDTYFSSTYTNMILETIYSSDGLCYSIGNYDYREYYQIISSTAGDANINPDDKDILFNTQSIPNGTYTLSVTAKDAAMNETIATMTIGINNTEVGILGLEEDMQFSIFPNPSNGYVNIENAKDCTFSLTDISGRKLKQFTSNDNNYKLDISSLNNGIYFLVLDGNGKHLCKKIVKL